ncbi:zinc finger B-box domain-containing protein 1 isoform X1 [Xiphophorus maculatus]|uniref:Zinc finger B-box domain containing n=1 Tax=Xiphophorus maculatus TaxID=8083 RepID=A0A3B5QJ81_XIPMA|nr:zinc finger B-box domain-containing protein 1 isoform X1 [Xiphophorus maculatus]
MNLNDYVVPNNKTRSVKLNARNLRKLQLDTTSLASESKNMEEKLKQLKESMSKEKEERRHFRDMRWKFGQCISSISNPQPNSFKKTNDNKVQKLTAGKIKIKVLKDEPLPASPQSSSSSSIPNAGLGMTRRTRVKGTISRKCEVKSTKLTDAQPQVISQGVSCFQRKINPGSFPGIYNPDSSRSPDSNHSLTFNAITTSEDEWPKNGTKLKQKQMKVFHNCSQVLVVKHGQEKAGGVIEDDKSELANSIFTGQYSEEESARSFQEALIQWRNERSEGKENLDTTDVLETPTTAVLVSAMSTQTDIPPGREADGLKREGAEGKLNVKFSENSLTYMDRLLLKKHRRTPVESPPSLAFGMGLKPPPTTDTEEEMATILTAEEEDFREYCSSLLKVPVSKDSTESQVSTPEFYLEIEILDEESTDMKMVPLTGQKLDSNTVSSQAVFSSTHSTQPSTPSNASVQQKAKEPHCLRDQILKNDSVKEEDSCAEKARIHGQLPREKSREMANNLEMSYREDLRPAKKKTEKDLQTEGTRQRPETHMVMQNQTAGFGSEQFCDLDGFLPLGLDTDTGHPDSSEQTHCDRLPTCQFSVRASDPTVHRSHSSLGCHSEEYLLCEVMKDRYEEPTGIQIHSTQREEMSANELGTSGSQLSQVIMEICGVDQTGCEDPDLDTDMTARMLHIMEQELQLVANTQCIPFQVFSLESEDSGGENEDESQHLKWDGPSSEQHEEENTTERDRRSVFLLP